MLLALILVAGTATQCSSPPEKAARRSKRKLNLWHSKPAWERKAKPPRLVRPHHHATSTSSGPQFDSPLPPKRHR